MNTKLICAILGSSLLLGACGTNLETLTFAETADDLIDGAVAIEEPRHAATTLPAVTVFNSEKFRFGPIHLSKEVQKDYSEFSCVTFLFNKKDSRKLAGVVIDIENTKQSTEILNYLKEELGAPLILEDIPRLNRDGFQIGCSSYLWYPHPKEERAVLLAQYYGTFANETRIVSLLYILDNRVKIISDADNGDGMSGDKLVVERLTHIYTHINKEPIFYER